MAEKKTNTETLGFQTEVKQLLKLMIHSLYSNKEIFLRELISNSSDACDKLRFSSLTNKKLLEDEDELQISVTVDKKLKTISISDNGIGMSKSEVIENIGTIAKSGTKEFLSKLTGDQTKDSQLIGQFGVGFYSAFIVSDLVTLITRKAGESENNGTKWISKGEGDYSVEKIKKKEKGTEIILRLKKDSVEFLESSRLKSTIQKFSDHITVPIMMFKEEWDKDKQKNIETKEFEKINQASALWVRSKSEISDKQYNEFYKHISHDFDDPLAWTHTKVEGRQDYTQLLFIPSRAPFDLWDREHKKGIKLYVKRIFIMDDADQLLPGYLRFVKGIVDSADLPLNVSREILQESKDVDSIRKGCVSRILNLLSSLLTKDIEKYKKFWTQFGKVLKEGIGEDFSNKEKISKLLLFSSTEKDSDEQTVSLTEYVKRMKKGQDKIYYVTADGYNAAKSSPHLEIFRDKGIEVLLLYDRVDEWVVSHLNEFDSKKIVSVAKGNLDLGELADEEKKLKEKNEDDFKELIEKIGKVIEGKASSVRLSDRLKDSPACIVVDENAMNANLERLMKEAGQSMPNSKPILEINPNHTIIKKLKDNKDESQINDWSHLLFDQALLAEGGNLDNPGDFVKQLNKIIISLTGEDSKIWTPK